MNYFEEDSRFKTIEGEQFLCEYFMNNHLESNNFGNFLE